MYFYVKLPNKKKKKKKKKIENNVFTQAFDSKALITLCVLCLALGHKTQRNLHWSLFKSLFHRYDDQILRKCLHNLYTGPQIYQNEI